MKGENLLPLILGSSGITAVVVALISALFNRRKLQAEATSIISNAAGGVVTNLFADNTRLREENAELRNENELLREQFDEFKKNVKIALDSLQQYATRQAALLQSNGIKAEKPPKITLPE